MNTMHLVSDTSRMRSSEAVAVRKSFSFRSLMMRVMLVVMMAVGGKVAWADSYTITFSTGSGDGSTASTSTACSTIVSAGATYLTGNLAIATKVNHSGDYGLKLGTSSAAGIIKMNLSATGCVTPTSIIVRAKRYNKAATLSVNGETAQNVTADFSDFTFDLSNQITYIQLNSSKYIWISSITVNYEPVASLYTVTFDHGSNNTSSLQEASVGSGVTLPTATAPGDCSAIYTFYGWAATSVSETSTAPSIVGTYGETYFPASNTTLHAVYRRVDGDIVYNLVENLSTVSEGKYYLLTPDYHAFNGTISSGHGQATANAFSFTNGVATSVPDGAVELTLSTSGDGFTMYNATYGYLYARDNNTGKLAWHNSESSYWEYSSYNWVYNDNNAYLRTFSNSSFRTYNGNTNDALLMAMEYEPAIYNTNPSCPSVTLTYHSNGATSGTAPTDINSPYNAGSMVTVLGSGTLEKTNCDFLGWNTAANGSGAEYSEGSHLYITENTDLYAQWGIKYTVTFNKGTGNCDTPSLPEPTACSGITLPEATPPATCSDYIFYGWSTSEISETSSEPLIVGTTGDRYYPSSDITLYAVYRQPNGGTVYNLITDLSTITEGEYYLVSTDNYAFNGTITGGDGQSTSDYFNFTDGVATSVPAGAVELTLSSFEDGFSMYNATHGYLYAIAASSGKLAWHNSESSYWNYSNSNWTYNSNNAYLRVYNNTFRTYGSNVNDRLKMAKKVDPAIYNTRPSCNTATITYNGNGATSGSVPVDGNTYDIGAEAQIHGNTGNLAKTGYTFMGWNTADDGSGIDYLEGDTIVLMGSVTLLYAKWTLNRYTVEWYVNGRVEESKGFDYNTPLPDGDIPEDPETPSICGGKFFVGWSETEFEETYVRPTLIKRSEMINMPVTDNKTYFAVFAKRFGDSDEIWRLVTNVNSLIVGDSVIIAAQDYGYAISLTQNNNNRGAASITKDGDDVTLTENVCKFELREGEVEDDEYNPTWAFYDAINDGYIYAAGGSGNNYLRTENPNDDNGNGSWKIEITNSGTKITAQGTSNRNKLQYNPNPAQQVPLFACYSTTSQEAVALYKKYSDGYTYSAYTTFCPCAFDTDGIDGDNNYIWSGKNVGDDWGLTSNWVSYNSSESKYHLAANEPTNSTKVFIINSTDCNIVTPTVAEDAICGNFTINGHNIDIAENKNLTINGAATFTSGIINGNVVFGEDATVSGTSTSSHVNGVVTKSGAANGFTFPTGSNGNLGKVEVTDGTATNVSVQYFSNPAGFSANDLPRWWASASVSGFDHVSNVEYWKISSTEAITANFVAEASSDMHFNSETEDEDKIPTNIQMAFYDNNRWTNVGGSASIDGNTLSINGAEIPASATRGISGNYTTFGSKSKSTVLPIELVSFTANCNGRSALIEWTTATEKNNDYFVLERSHDAVNFKEIARIAGAGNSIEPISYAYTDYGVRNGDNYYRLVQVDYDGTSTTSEIIVANCPAEASGEPEVLAFPNPFDDNLTLHFENFGNMQATVEVYDMLGRLVQTQKVNCSQNDYEVVLRLAGLSDGTYNVRISTADFVINRKVVKE